HWKGKHPNEQICPLCKKDYSNKVAFLGFLTEHMLEHSSEEYETYLQIKVPEIKFLRPDPKKNKSANEATASNTGQSMKVGEYLCPLCKKSFTALTDMISHIDDHKQVKNLYCSVCKLQFKTDGELKRHMQTHEIQKFNLVQDKEFKSHESIEKYDSVIHNSPCARRECVTETNSESINCPICFISFIDKTAAVSHFQRLHICPICEIFLPTKTDMDDHIKSHACQTCQIAKSVHQIKSKGNNVIQKTNCCIFCKSKLNDNSFVCVCNICNKRLPISQYLKLHVMGHAEHFKYRVCNKDIVRKSVPAPYGCFLCHINFGNNQLFMEHMNVIHCYDKETNLYMCSICNIGFNEVIELKIHNEEHLEKINLLHNKKYVCFICDKLFETLMELKTHNATVHSICTARERTCSVCYIHFVNALELNIHMRSCKNTYNPKEVLETEKIPCPLCKWSFWPASRMNIHIMTHYTENIKGLF
ncbi:unnamed protein product, partial [Meganyctiphanes norvegica]